MVDKSSWASLRVVGRTGRALAPPPVIFKHEERLPPGFRGQPMRYSRERPQPPAPTWARVLILLASCATLSWIAASPRTPYGAPNASSAPAQHAPRLATNP